MNKEQLMTDLIVDEGIRTELYRCTAGKQTIGVGRNIQDRGISKGEAMFLLANDIDSVCDELDARLYWWRDLPQDVQLALANMAFNMGVPKLLKFERMLEDLENKRFGSAAEEALDSRWAEQVGDRADRIAKLIRSA
jgi:lysozyme